MGGSAEILASAYDAAWTGEQGIRNLAGHYPDVS